MTDFILEIGTEEIPAADLSEVLEQLYAAFIELKQKHNLFFDDRKLEVMGTPRRLAALIGDFPTKQADVVSKKVKGPPAEVSFKNGKPTPAATGFAKAQGVRVEDLKIEPTDKADYLFAVTTRPGQPADKVLAQALPSVIESLEFKKAMRWRDDVRFIRPVRWLAALLGGKVINFTYAGLKAARATYGHRLLNPKKLAINDASQYKRVMRQAKVVVEPEKRARLIERAIKRVKQGNVDMDDARIQQTFCEVVNLVENPSILIGQFDKKFLKLPRKVVETVLQSHQRYLPIIKSKQPPLTSHPRLPEPGTGGQVSPLTNSFLVVQNGDPKKEKLIKHGHEKVVRARLEDAEFYLKEDLRKKLSSRVNDLKGIVFHRELGTLLDKTKRLEYFVKKLATELAFSEKEKAAVSRAAHFSKADLLTSMVAEFDELQGFIGAEYALLEGESKTVAKAVYEQYLPRFSKDARPESKAGCLLSIADRMDTLCAYISKGIIPTSAGDPYALRRQSTGMVQVIFDCRFRISVNDFAGLVYRRLSKDFKNLATEHEVVGKVFDLVNQRTQFLLSQMNIDYDIIRAVAGLNIERPIEFKERALALQNIRNTASEALQDLVTVCNRASRIADKKFGLKVSKLLLKEAAEKNLYDNLIQKEKQLDKSIANNNFKEAIVLLAQTKDTVDDFFDEVLVMAKEKELRKNRHAMLNRFVAVCLKVADLSKIEKSS